MKLMRPAAMLCALALTVGGVTALAAVQGSQEDPLLTLSYLQSVLRPQLEQEVDAAVAANEKALTEKLDAAIAGYEKQVDEALAASSGAAFQTKNLSRGEELKPGAGRELLVVSGSLTALDKLTDTTAGKSVGAGESLEAGHLYVTVSDKSGCMATTSASVMSR